LLAAYRRDPSFSARVGFVVVFTVELAFPQTRAASSRDSLRDQVQTRKEIFCGTQ
jgi:hypothetical protein